MVWIQKYGFDVYILTMIFADVGMDWNVGRTGRVGFRK